MCGIVGRAGASAFDGERAIAKALRAMNHRGPDSSGWTAFGSGSHAIIGAVRLRIIDLSEHADQPMSNRDRSTTVVFNGELYNHRELRSDLMGAGHPFGNHSDTECLVHLYDEVDGDIRAMLTRLRGMFAFAIWDNRRQRLVLARDRLGIKPLAWAEVPGGIAFASEVRALTASGWVTARPDVAAVGRYLQWGVVTGPGTIVDGVRRLAPGEFLTWTARTGTQVEQWWSPQFTCDMRLRDATEARREMVTVLTDSVARHLLADRPVGLFLSSGTDSVAIASTAVRLGTTRALTVTFPENPDLDEGPVARAIAQRMNLDHHEVPTTGADVVSNLDTILRSMDSPSADAVNSWLVCRAAREAGLTVALSGLGGDELLAGYRSFRLAPLLHRAHWLVAMIPGPLRDRWIARLSASSPGSRLARVLAARPGIGGAYSAVRELIGTEDLAFYGVTVDDPSMARVLPTGNSEAVMQLELEHYLADQLLPDTDSVSMSHSIEVRVPLLDDLVVNTAFALPHATRRKALLADAAGLPAANEKRTFTAPFTDWMRGPLRETVREGLCSEALPFPDLVPRNLRTTLWRQVEQQRGHWSRAWAVTVLRLWPSANGFRWL